MQVERAQAADLPGIEALLAGAALPLDGAGAAFATGVVVREDGRVVGAAAIERYGSAGLLRSVVVAPDRRGMGIGGELLASSEALAHELGIDELYLLTDSAEAWFARRGYAVVDRERVPDDVRESIEFTTACAATAVAMTKAEPDLSGGTTRSRRGR